MRQATRQALRHLPGPVGCGRCRGFSLFELAVAVIVVAIAAAIALGRLAYYEEAAEKAKMQATVSALKSALRIRMSALMIAGRVHEYPALAAQNPFDWLDRKPDDYRGVRAAAGRSQDSAPGWYFDSAERTLVYLPRNARHLQPDSQGLKRIRLKVVSVTGWADSVSATAGDSTPNISLRLVEPYRWFDSL